MKSFWKHTAFILLPLLSLSAAVFGQSTHSLLSPNKQIEVKIRAADRFQYDVLFKGTPLLQNSTFSINIDHNTLGLQPKVKSAKERSYNGTLEPVVRQKFAKIQENYNELRLTMEGNYAVVFRAYNEGVAYRLETSLPQSEVKVYSEESSFNFADDYKVFYPQEESFFSHNERHYLPMNLKTIAPTAIASLPAVVDAANGVKVAIAESDIEDYPGLWLRGTGGNGLAATFPPVSSQGNAGERPRFQSYGSRRLHRGHPRDSQLSVAADGHRGERRRPDHEPIGLAAGQAFASTRHVVDQARQSRMGLVERAQHRRRGFQIRCQHPDLQVLRGFRCQVWLAVHHPRRRMVQTRQSAGSRLPTSTWRS